MVDTVHGVQLETLLTAEAIDARVRELAERIERDYHDRPLTVIGVLKGSVFFLVDLIRRLRIPLRLEFVRASSYGSEMTSSGTVKLSELDESFEGRHVLIVDDILDSGRTLLALKERIARAHPASVKTCVLVDKRTTRAVPMDADYRAFEIEDVFIVGYGLDWAEQFRNLPHIARVIPTDGARPA